MSSSSRRDETTSPRSADGRARAYWIDLDSLIEIKSRIDDPRHQEDARILRMVRERRERAND